MQTVTTVDTEYANNDTKRVQLHLADGSIEFYDHVIMACHSDTTLDILRTGNLTEEEERILGSFKWNRNEAVLHFDTKVTCEGQRSMSVE